MTVMISPISAFADNYIWLLERDEQAIVVDPGDARPAREALQRRGLKLAAILVTHHHMDHAGGVAQLQRETGAPAYGPRLEASRIDGLSHLLDDGDRFRVDALDLEFQAMVLPGHTQGQIAYVGAGMLFCGDTLFSAGCGRLFEGTAAEMHDSLSRLAELPADTAMYCGHEYTLANLAFAAAVEPGNSEIEADAQRVRELRANGEPSLPSTIGRERRINPFLRCSQPAVRQAAERRAGRLLGEAVEVFTVLRSWKDQFRAATP